MASMVIAGRPNSEDTSKCILLAENLQSLIPTARYIKVLKHPIDWAKYSETICNLFGFQKKSHPLIFFSNGNYIGGKEEYFKLIKNNFNLPSLFNADGNFLIDFEIVENLTREHINQVNREYLIHKQGFTIRDRIEERLEKLSSVDLRTSAINDRYNTLDTNYSKDFLGDMKIFYKINQKFSPALDENVFQENPLEENKIFVDTEHEQSIIINTQENLAVSANSRKSIKNLKDVSLDYSHEEYEEEKNVPKKKELIYYTHRNYKVPEILLDFSEYNKYEIEENFGFGFKILLNPYLTFYGEVVLITEVKNMSSLTLTSSSSKMIINDAGKIPSLRPITYSSEILPYIKTGLTNIAESSAINPISYLDRNLINFSMNAVSLSEHDVYSMLTAIKTIEGIATLRILPYKYADWKHLGSSKIKIIKLPLKDINYESIPLTLKVEQEIKNLKRDKMKCLMTELKNGEKDAKINHLIENEDFTHYFELNEFFTIESYSQNGIKHLVKSYNEFNMNSANVISDLKTMFKELNINNETGYGFNLILTKTYLFVAPLVNPFILDKEIPLFADPHFFAGIFTLPLIEAEWPETVKGKYLSYDFVEILRKSTNSK